MGLTTIFAGGLLAGCAPRSLGFDRDDTIQQGSAGGPTHSAYGSVELQNVTGSKVVLQSLQLTGLDNAKVSDVAVIKIIRNNAFGFYSPPLLPGMKQELASSVPVKGFTLPAHTREEYEIVFRLSAINPSRDATSKAAIVGYQAGPFAWTETRNSGYCLYAHINRGCDRQFTQ